MPLINDELALPCGATLENRIAKAALTERLANPDHLPNELHWNLYKTWTDWGPALQLTGNILIDKRYLEASGNIVIEKSTEEVPFRKWTKIVTSQNKHIWAQLNHAGRQSTIFSTLKPVSASNVKLKKVGLFAKPRALTNNEIIEIKERFVHGAKFCQKVGFSGIQFHAAHGYLLSQFLSSRTNKRQDEWGGSLDNRAKLLLDIVSESRKAVGPDFPISVKLNSADFQRGGFQEEDALYVIRKLEERGIDLLEISGGTYEDVTFFTKKGLKQSTLDREAYFIDFAKKVRAESHVAIMVTGGFRSRSFCDEVLDNGELDMIGFGRPFLLEDRFSERFLEGSLSKVQEPNVKSVLSAYYDFTVAGYYDYQIKQLATGGKPKLAYPGWKALPRMSFNEFWKGLKNRALG